MIDVVLPVLDEAQALPWVLTRMPEGFHAVVADNGSSDGSAGIAAALGATVVHEPQQGFGAACFAGLEACRSDFVCFMDCDGSLDPADLVDVAGPVVCGDAEMVLGARRPDRGAMPGHARVANRMLALELRRRTGLPLTDLGPMRSAPRAALLGLELRDRRFGWPLEMVLRAHAAGWRVCEVPVRYRVRAGGQSKITGTARGTVRAVRDMARVLR